MSFGKSYLLKIDGCIYDGWFVLREYEKNFNQEFLLHVLNSHYLQKQYKRLSTGGVVQNISSDIVYSTFLFRPILAEQQKIANFLSSIDSKIESVAKQITESQNFKKGLLQQMFV
jgi:type I restriction enzyme S subunit